jgi:glycosyltransferase involved in cell wall biosynthesis
MMDLSIVIPVYNVEKYLSRCLDSIFRQEFKGHFEVIAVNDFSDDSSSLILDEYCARYDNFKVISHSENRSLAVARKSGIDEAKGEYLMHIDSDDWIKEGALNEIFQNIKKYNNPDVIVFNYERNDGKKTLLINNEIIVESYFSQEVDKSNFQKFFLGGVWNKVVKLNLVKNMVYGNTYMNTTEDLIYCTEIFLDSNSFLFVPKSLYVYFVNRKSLTSLVSPEKYFKSQVLVYDLLIQIKEKRFVKNNYIKTIDNYLYSFLMLEFFKTHFVGKVKQELIDELQTKYNKFSVDNKFSDLERINESILFAFKKFGLFFSISFYIKLIFRKYVWNLFN